MRGLPSPKHRRERKHLISRGIELDALKVGDVVLFAERNGAFVSVKACRWVPYTFAAFVMGHAEGDVLLCGHFPGASTNEGLNPTHTASVQGFRRHIRQASYEAIYIRQLCHPLDEKQQAALQHVSQQLCGEDVSGSVGGHSSDEETMVLMAGVADSLWARLSCRPRAERFVTSRLIGEMLAATEQAQREGHRYVADTHDGRLLQPLQEVSPNDFVKSRSTSLRYFKSAKGANPPVSASVVAAG